MARKKLIEVALPLEAINKAMIEIPPKFAGRPPVNPEANPHARHSGESRNPYLTQTLDPGFRRGDEAGQAVKPGGPFFALAMSRFRKVRSPAPTRNSAVNRTFQIAVTIRSANFTEARWNGTASG